MIVKKMAGQNIYKGSNSNGVRSLSLPKWRESFVVSGTEDEEKKSWFVSDICPKDHSAVLVGKPKKGVVYPSTLDYVPSRPTYVKTGEQMADVVEGSHLSRRCCLNVESW